MIKRAILNITMFAICFAPLSSSALTRGHCTVERNGYSCNCNYQGCNSICYDGTYSVRRLGERIYQKIYQCNSSKECFDKLMEYVEKGICSL